MSTELHLAELTSFQTVTTFLHAAYFHITTPFRNTKAEGFLILHHFAPTSSEHLSTHINKLSNMYERL